MDDLAELASQLGHVAHFQHLPPADLAAIVKAGRVRRCAAASILFHEGAPSSGLFVLLAGRVHLVKLGPDGQEVILAVVEPVIMFNEVPALDGGPNVATALAVEECVVWQTGAEAFHVLLARYPEMGLGLLTVLARRNRFLISQYEDLSFRSVLARTAKLLLDLSQYGSRPIDRGRHPNVEMAARIATVPEAFSRSLRVFRQNNYIHSTRDTLIVCEPETLAHLAQIGPVLPKE